jgi:hypothetical protein
VIDVLQAILATLSPTVALVVFAVTFSNQRRSERIRILFDMQERYVKDSCRAGRKMIHSHVAGRKSMELEDLDPFIRKQIGDTLAVLNTIAVCVLSGYCDRRLVRQTMGRSFVGTMLAAGPYLDFAEKQRGFRAYSQAEQLARRLAQG